MKQIYFVITRRCNLFCSHCIRSSGPGIKDFLSLADIESALVKLYPYSQNAELLISGGEPTLHPEFKDIVSVVSVLYKKVTINTNGLRLKHLQEAASISPLLAFQISIDGDEEFHNNIRGKGTFVRALEAIHALAENGSDVTIATTLNRHNAPSLKNLDHLLTDISFKKWTVQREVIYGRADAYKSLSTEEWNTLAQEYSLSFNNKDRLSMKTMFSWAGLQKLKEKNPEDLSYRNCGTGHSKLYINPDLTVFPCGCLEEIILGDLSKDSAEKILQEMTLLQTTINPKSPCVACPFNKVCNGGCPGHSFHKFGTFGMGDPRCQAVSHFLATPI